MRKIILTFALSATVLSCSIQGFTNDYSKLSAENKAKVVPLPDFDNVSQENIYKINAKQLKEELAKHSQSLVYVFKNGCTSELCRPMFVYENYAKKNGYKLFLVMNGYANLNQTLDQRNSFNSPLFSIDNEHYNSNNRNTYIRFFKNELQGKPFDEKSGDYLGNLFFFKGNQLEKIVNDLPKS